MTDAVAERVREAIRDMVALAECDSGEIAAVAAHAARGAIAEELIENGPVLNYELNYDGTEDPLRAAYVEGHRDAVMIVRDSR